MHLSAPPATGALTQSALTDSNHPLAVFFRLPRQPFELLGPGAVAVQELPEARVILDPGINFVIVRRDAWRNAHSNQISATLSQLHEQSQVTHLHGTWSSVPQDHYSCVPDRLAYHFGRRGIELISEPGFAWMLNDVLHQISFLKDLSCAEKIFLNSRLAEVAPRLTEPAKHTDDQFLTMSCAYLGGGTVCEIEPGSVIQLARGEIGIWKGTVGAKRDMVVEEPENYGQALVHWTPFGQTDYPRFVSLIDAYDEAIPESLEQLGTFTPWRDLR